MFPVAGGRWRRPAARPRRWAPAGLAAPVAVLAALGLAACDAPRPPPPPVAVSADDARPDAAAAFAAGPDAAYARAREEQKRGIGVPPALPSPGPGEVDRLRGALRASRPAPGTGPAVAGPPPAVLPVPSNALSRLSALPASPLANPPGGFAPGRP